MSRRAQAERRGRELYGEHDPSTGPKAVVTAVHVSVVLVALWLLAGGTAALADRVGISVDSAEPLRRALLATLAVVYLVRLAVTMFLLQERKMEWPGAAVISTWLVVIHLTMALLGSTNGAEVGVTVWLGVMLYLVGSSVNTCSEWQRKRWKDQPGHDGRLYTGGLFRYAVHINYFGDLVLFSGFAMVTGRPWAALIPAGMLAIFCFGNIPRLDRHLAERYGADFRAYSARTPTLVPFLR